MSIDILKRLALFIGLGAVQILILNHIRLFGLATPLLFVYFVITFQRNTPKWAILLWSFAMGLAIDVFTNTPGLSAGSLTLIAAIQPYLLELFVPRDSSENLEVSAASLSMGKFFTFSTILTALFVLVFFALEFFSFYNWVYWLECAGTSFALTMILIFAIESFRIR